MAEIVIHDTGQGIAKDALAKIFDPFFTTKNEGTGLGLAIAYRIMEDHQGTISVDSQEGSGTQFSIRIPLAEGKSENIASRMTTGAGTSKEDGHE